LHQLAETLKFFKTDAKLSQNLVEQRLTDFPTGVKWDRYKPFHLHGSNVRGFQLVVF